MKKKALSIGSAILAGGRNSRMGGKNKAFLQINGIPIIQRTINLLNKIFDEIMIITNSKGEYKAYQKRCRIIEDKIKEIGPLGGIYSGLSATSKDAVFFVPCDMPFLHNDMVQLVISWFNKTNCDAVVPEINSLIEPLHSIYNKKLADKLLHFINTSSDHSVRNFLQTIKVHYLNLEDNDFHRKIFKNINTIKDWKKE